MRALAAGLAALWLALSPSAPAQAAPPTSCESCHSDAKRFGEAQRELVKHFRGSVHASVGLSCQDCHGGDPDPALAGDRERAMDPESRGHPFRGTPSRAEIPAFCGGCHSDPIYMRDFRPDPRIDQEREYATSQHGLALARGDPNVATCVDCHGVHGILRVTDSRAPVYPTHVADTCGRCHADAARMAGYRTEDGRPLPTDQYAGWRTSVHAAALLERGDLSAPTCNDCHGNHGARPPGLDSLAAVCGSCHGREAQLFRGSPKQEGFERHNEVYLADGAACSDCHAAPEPQAKLAMRRFSECATCHGHHQVLRPTLAMLSPLPETPCALCHESESPAAADEEELGRVRQSYERTRDALLAEAGGREGDALFDWMVDRTLTLPAHHRIEAGGPAPQVARLFERLRIGRIHPLRAGPDGRVEPVSIVRCSDCHAKEPILAGGGHPYETGLAFLDGIRALTVLSVRSERTLLAARRGGVELQEPLTHLDQALARTIELQALIHGFDAAPSSAFVAKQKEGLEHARSALAGARAGIAELAARRKGLAVALGLVVLVLVALGLRIRRMSAP